MNGSLWHYVWKLGRLQLVIFFSGLKRSKRRRKIGMTVLALFVAGLAAFLFWLSWIILGFLRSPAILQYADPSLLLNSIPSIILTLAFLAILLTNFGVLLQALYLSGDMDFLLSTPVPIRAVFLTKLLQAILPNFGLICLFTLPVLFGLGASSHYFFPYYLLVLISLGVLTLAAGGISSLLVMAVVRVIPARRVAEVLGFIGVITSVAISQGGRFLGNFNFTSSNITGGLNVLAKANTPFSPLALIGQGLVDIGVGQWLPGLGLLVVTLGIAGGIFWIAMVSAERLYYSGWASLQGNPHRKKKRAIRSAASSMPVSSGLPGSARAFTGSKPAQNRLFPPSLGAMIRKDLILLRRDLRHLSQLITPLILGVVVIISMARTGLESGSFPSRVGMLSGNESFYISIIFALFVGWSLMLSLTLGTFSREGRNYWLVQSAPVSTRTLLFAKYLVSFLPALLFEWILLVIITFLQQPPISTLLFGMLMVAFFVSGAIGINLAFGVIGARLDWQDPRQMNSTQIGCLGTVVSFIYLPVSAALFLLPQIGFPLLGLNPILGGLIGLVLGGVFCVACAILPPFAIRNRVARIGQK